MDNNSAIKAAAQKELLRRAAQKELERRRATASPEMSLAEKGMDVLKGAGTGLVKGVTGLLGGFGDVQKQAGDIVAKGAESLGLSPEMQSSAKFFGDRMLFPLMGGSSVLGKMPTSETLKKPIEENLGPLPEAETLPGQIAERFGEYAPSAFAGPGGVLRKTALAAAPAVASELAGRAPGVEGSPYQPYVETGAGLVAGLPVALSGKGAALKEMREKAPTQEVVSSLSKEAYDKLDDAGIMFDAVSTRRAVSKIRDELSARGLEAIGDGPAARLYKNVNDLIRGKTARNWTNIDRILKEGKKVLRSNADATVKGDVGVIVNNLEKLVKSGKITSTSGLSRDEINSTIDVARELARRNILASEIEKMKGRMFGYLGGDESAFRNQFGAYLKSPKGVSLKPAEREAFSRVVRREGPLNIANSMSSRIGQIAGSTGGMGVGALTGSALGPMGTIGGAVLGAGVTAGTQLAFRKAMERVTEKAVDDALKTVLAGREAQGMALKKEKIEDMRRIIRTVLLSEAAAGPLQAEIDIPGGDLPVSENAGGRVARKSGGRIKNSISDEVRKVRALCLMMRSQPLLTLQRAIHNAKSCRTDPPHPQRQHGLG
jgi:hypothetical protein